MNRARRSILVTCLLLLTLSGLTNADSQDSFRSQAAAADTAYQAKDWKDAESLYDQLVHARPDNARSWYRLGVCRQGVGQPQQALDAFLKAQALGMPISIVGYNLAIAYASVGQTDKAMEQLTNAVKDGYAQPDQLAPDPGLQSLRQDSRFSPLVEQSKRNQKPCAHNPENRQFDFWVGDWDVVRTEDGSPAGHSHIERVISDCVIWENWTSLGNAGYSGKSYNAYNPNLKRWEQFWVDSDGGMIHFYGELKDSVMDCYTDDVPQTDGSKLKRHLQFFNLGSNQVRQCSRGSKDGGKTWTVEYDLTYKRTK